MEFSVLEIIFHFKPAQFICRPHLVQIIRKIYVSKQAVAGGDIIMCINKNYKRWQCARKFTALGRGAGWMKNSNDSLILQLCSSYKYWINDKNDKCKFYRLMKLAKQVCKESVAKIKYLVSQDTRWTRVGHVWTCQTALNYLSPITGGKC